jgi:hypothetical protein
VLVQNPFFFFFEVIKSGRDALQFQIPKLLFLFFNKKETAALEEKQGIFITV